MSMLHNGVNLSSSVADQQQHPSKSSHPSEQQQLLKYPTQQKEPPQRSPVQLHRVQIISPGSEPGDSKIINSQQTVHRGETPTGLRISIGSSDSHDISDTQSFQDRAVERNKAKQFGYSSVLEQSVHNNKDVTPRTNKNHQNLKNLYSFYSDGKGGGGFDSIKGGGCRIFKDHQEEKQFGMNNDENTLKEGQHLISQSQDLIQLLIQQNKNSNEVESLNEKLNKIIGNTEGGSSDIFGTSKKQLHLSSSNKKDQDILLEVAAEQQNTTSSTHSQYNNNNQQQQLVKMKKEGSFRMQIQLPSTNTSMFNLPPPQVIQQTGNSPQVIIDLQSTWKYLVQPSYARQQNVVYHQNRDIKLEYEQQPQQSNGLRSSTTAQPLQKLINQDALDDFYSTKVRLFPNLGRELEVDEEPEGAFPASNYNDLSTCSEAGKTQTLISLSIQRFVYNSRYCNAQTKQKRKVNSRLRVVQSVFAL